MKKAQGVCWRYRNSPARGMTWAAELNAGHAILCVFGQKQLRSAIMLANKYAKRLGWRQSEPWNRLDDASGCRRAKRRQLK